jgi:hypothetical protein
MATAAAPWSVQLVLHPLLTTFLMDVIFFVFWICNGRQVFGGLVSDYAVI